MGSTLKTPNYQLSQFTATDKPSWINDYDSDMRKIDTGIAEAKTLADTADGSASGALAAAQAAQLAAESAQTAATAANTKANEASTTATTALTQANKGVTDAATAFDHADTAITLATEADDKAVAATTAATNAQNTATAANTTAGQAKTSAETAQNGVNALEEISKSAWTTGTVTVSHASTLPVFKYRKIADKLYIGSVKGSATGLPGADPMEWKMALSVGISTPFEVTGALSAVYYSTEKYQNAQVCMAVQTGISGDKHALFFDPHSSNYPTDTELYFDTVFFFTTNI